MALLTTALDDGLTIGDVCHCIPDRPVLHRLPATIDRGRFFVRDTIAQAEVPNTGPHVGGLSSKSVKDCRLSAGEKIVPRCKSNVGITGGHVIGAKGDTEVTRGAQRETVLCRRALKREKRAARDAAKRAFLIAELQRRGYSVA